MTRTTAALGIALLVAALAAIQWQFGSTPEEPATAASQPAPRPPLSAVARLEPLHANTRTAGPQAAASSPSTACPHRIDPYDGIQVGGTYYLPKRTPLMPHYDPPDPATALSQIRYVEGVKVKVLRKHTPRPPSPPWYEVQTEADRAWINGAALAGQCVEEVDRKVKDGAP